MAAEPRSKRILVTGIADPFVGAVVRELEADNSVESITGVDFREPRRPFKRAEVMVADLRSRALQPILEAIRPDTVLHMQQISAERDGVSPEESHEINVMGTLNLAASLQRAPSMRKFVMLSSLHVYGGSPTDPALLSEDGKPRMPAKSKFAGDLIEMENIANLLVRGERKLSVACLRFADLIGRRCHTPMARYLRMPVVPSLWGYDPRLQFCHEDDAISILKRAALEDLSGLYNVAADGAVYLSQALRLGKRTQFPIAPPLMGLAMSAAKFAGLTPLDTHHWLTLRYGRVIDNTKARARFGEFRYPTRDAVLDLYGLEPRRAPAVEDELPEETRVAAA